MDQHNNQTPIGERVARLELQMEQLDEIKTKLDELLGLKDKGAGAVWVFSLIVGSGILGIVWTIINFFGHPHL